MPFEEGNQWWKQRSKHGRNPIWDDREKLLEACYEYVKWVEENPLKEAIVYQGELRDDASPKLRAMTIKGLCIFLGITDDTWASYRDSEHDFIGITKEIEMIIYTQKFEGAAANLLNPNIISRELGLKDQQDVTSGGKPVRNEWHVHPVTTKKDATD